MVKRKFMRCLAVLLLILFCLPVYTEVFEVRASGGRRLVDEAGLLDRDQEEELEKQLDALAEKYELDAVIVMVDDYAAYDPSLYAYSPESFAQSYYQSKGFGFDRENSGIILVVSMEERDWYIYVQGEARRAVNDYGLDYISERLVERLGKDDYEGAVSRYADDLEDFFKEYQKGTPYGDDHTVKTAKRMLIGFGTAAGISLLLALIIVSAMKAQMNTARPQNTAQEYVRQGSFNLTQQQDLYLYSNVTKTPKPKDTSSGSGSGRSSGSRGSSGRGGKF